CGARKSRADLGSAKNAKRGRSLVEADRERCSSVRWLLRTIGPRENESRDQKNGRRECHHSRREDASAITRLAALASYGGETPAAGAAFTSCPLRAAGHWPTGARNGSAKAAIARAVPIRWERA